MTKIFIALTISFFAAPLFANQNPDLVFQCGQDFQRELSLVSNNEFVLSEGFPKGALESLHAYFVVSNSDLRWSKNKCQIELKALKIEGPNGRAPRNSKLAYKFKFQFLKSAGPTSLVLAEDGKPPVTCTVSPKFVDRMKDCQLPTEIPEAMTCQSLVVDGTQVKTIFRYDPKSGISERQVFKVAVLPPSPDAVKVAGPAPASVTSVAQEKAEDLGTRGTKFQWNKKGRSCELAIKEKEEDDDHWLDFKMKLDARKGSPQAGEFQKMRILLDHEHVADLLDDKKKVQCVVSAQVLKQSARCANIATVKLRSPAKASGKAKVLTNGQ